MKPSASSQSRSAKASSLTTLAQMLACRTPLVRTVTWQRAVYGARCVAAEIDLWDSGGVLRRVEGHAVLVCANDAFAYVFTDFASSGEPIQVWRYEQDITLAGLSRDQHRRNWLRVAANIHARISAEKYVAGMYLLVFAAFMAYLLIHASKIGRLETELGAQLDVARLKPDPQP